MSYEFIMYVFIVSGVCIMESSELHMTVVSFRNRFIIRRGLRSSYGPIRKNYGPLGSYITKILINSGADSFFMSWEQFMAVTVMIFLIITGGLMIFMPLHTALFVGAVGASMPYVFTLVGLSSRRKAGSREGDIVVAELLNNYRIMEYNMKEAVEMTAIEIENAPVAKTAFMNLARNLNNSSSEKELNRALDMFRYAFNTSWADILSSNVFFAVHRGIIVDHSLEDLNRAMVKSKKLIEHSKRENYESKLILKYLIPITYGSSVFVGIRFFNVTPGQFIKFQFGTATGIKWFTATAICYLAGVVCLRLFSEEKMDL